VIARSAPGWGPGILGGDGVVSIRGADDPQTVDHPEEGLVMACTGTCTYQFTPSTGWRLISKTCFGAGCDCPPKPNDTPPGQTIRILACQVGFDRLARKARVRIEIGPRVSLEIVRYPPDPLTAVETGKKPKKGAVTRQSTHDPGEKGSGS
jgi:hypothetical protein